MSNQRSIWGQFPFKICFNKSDDTIINGVVVSGRLIKPMPFHDISTLILELDHIMNVQQYPQSYNEGRLFKQVQQKQTYSAGDLSESMDKEIIDSTNGSEQTILLFVESRISGCWQGVVLIDNNRFDFKSSLEFVNIVEDVLDI